MSGRFASCLALICVVCACTVTSAAIYNVPENSSEIVGAWDVNIVADDVHFETPSIIREIRMPMAIKGSQTCALWIFDELYSDPVLTMSFSNQPAAHQYDFNTYVFEMQLQVPKDIYVGFSAQGDGWTNTLSDYWSRGAVILQGVAGSPGQYAFGAVSGGQLNSLFVSGESSYGSLEILAQPVQVTEVGVVTGQVSLAFTSLPIYGTNSVERSETADGTNWQDRGTLPLGVFNTTWNESNSITPSSFYRVKTR